MAYVYAIKVDGVVRYVGKGTGRRVRRHVLDARQTIRRRNAGERIRVTPFAERLIEALKVGAMVQSTILVDDLTHEQAFTLEIDTIAALPLGQLWNGTPGGDGGGSPGRLVTETARAKSRESNKKAWSDPELKRQQSERMKALWATREYRARQNKTQRPTAKQMIAEKARARWSSPEFRAKIAETFASEKFRSRRSEAIKLAWKRRREQKNAIQRPVRPTVESKRELR